jgi:hypothetical protein
MVAGFVHTSITYFENGEKLMHAGSGPVFGSEG